MRTPKLLTGQEFGYWTVLDECNRYGHRTYWKCRCECGEERFVRADDLKAGNSKSCGCKKLDVRKKTIAKKYLDCYN